MDFKRYKTVKRIGRDTIDENGQQFLENECLNESTGVWCLVIVEELVRGMWKVTNIRQLT